jgi:hypothetical protein
MWLPDCLCKGLPAQCAIVGMVTVSSGFESPAGYVSSLSLLLVFCAACFLKREYRQKNDGNNAKTAHPVYLEYGNPCDDSVNYCAGITADYHYHPELIRVHI